MNTLVQPPELAAGHAVTACPACGGVQNAVVGGIVPAFDSPTGGRMFRQPTFSIRCCPGCGLYFKSHTLSPEELDAYYTCLEFDAYEHDGNSPTDRILHDLLNRLPAGRKILDFGCNTGGLIKELTIHHRCFGVEINAAAAAIACARGIQVITEENVRAGEQCDFDAIILADVYEHLPQPLELLTVLVKALKPGGWLAIVTGNADAVRTRDRMGEFWYFGSPGHLLMMSEQHVRWLADRLGVRVKDLYRCSHYDLPFRQRAKQHIQSFAYHQFHRNPRGLISTALRLVPVIQRAEHWPNAPALTCTADHFVAVLQKR